MDKLQFALKLRKATTAEQLVEMLNSEAFNKEEKSKIQEKLDKLGVTAPINDEPTEPKKAIPKKKVEEPTEPEQETPVASKPIKKTDLTEAEIVRLEEAEARFQKRQQERRTPPKVDATMRTDAPRTTRENLESSKEVEGVVVGGKAKIKGTDDIGTVVRIYISDGKEKCMLKIGDAKPIKKRVIALEPA